MISFNAKDTVHFKNVDAIAISYNRSMRNANWVAEHLKKEWIDNEEGDRSKSHFKLDPDVPKEFQSRARDFVKSGWDKGHLAPAADMHSSQQKMDESFFITNVSPQHPQLNRNFWSQLEKFIRNLTLNYQDVFVITGPLFLAKMETDGNYYVKYQKLQGHTSVPTHFFKVILARNSEMKSFSTAFLIPNAPMDPSEKNLESFQVPIDGFSFFKLMV